MLLSELSPTPVWFAPPPCLKDLKWNALQDGNKYCSTHLMTDESEIEVHYMLIELSVLGASNRGKVSFKVTPKTGSAGDFTPIFQGAETITEVRSKFLWLNEDQAKGLARCSNDAWR